MKRLGPALVPVLLGVGAAMPLAISAPSPASASQAIRLAEAVVVGWWRREGTAMARSR